MENKNFYKSCNPEFKNRLFFESRLLMKNDPVPEDKEPAAGEKPKKSPRKKAEEVEDEAQQAKTKLKGKIQRDKFKKDEKLPEKGPRGSEKEDGRPRKAPEKRIQVPTKPKLDMQVYLEKNFRDEKTGPAPEEWSLAIEAEKTQINWQSWDHSTVEGVQKIYDDCQDLNLINQDVEYYDSTFAILRNSADKNINTNLATDDIRNAFLKPADQGNREKIAALPPIAATPQKEGFPGGEAFLKAFDHLTYIKAQVYALNNFQKDTLKKQREAGEDPIGGKVTDFVRSNVATFQKAIRERDYATAGVYALGAYAIWQTLGKKIFGGDHHAGGDAAHKGFDYKKWLLIGAAVYCGNKFAKNAGYDILKMTGFKTGDAEVAGTPMEVLSNILQKSEFSEQTKDLDYGIVLTMSETSLTTLEDLRKQSNTKGIHFIHPREFPDLFPDLNNVWPFKMGLGEEGLKDYVGMSNTKLSPKEKEYIRVGQQIYKLSLAMQATYDETLHQHNKKFRGKTYQDALKENPYKDSKVRHLMAAVHKYANERVPGGLFSGKKKQEIQALLNENLEKSGLKGESFALENEIQEGTRHYWAKLHGFPVVVVASSTGYRVYLRGDYGKNYNSAPGPGIAEIPLQGPGAKSAMETIIKAIDKKMRELVDKSPILGDKKAILSSLKYVNGQWQCKVDDPAIPDLDIAGGKSIVPIDPDEDGLSIIGKSLDRRSRFPTEILPRLVGQPQFHALTIFLGAGALDAKYDPAKPGKFTLVIGKKKQIEVGIAYTETGSTGSFSFANSAREAELFKSGSGFSEELSDALGEDANLKGAMDTLKKLIDNADESYVRNFFKSLPKWFTNITWANVTRGIELKDITGSVAKNYTIGLIDAQKSLILAKMAGSADGATKLTDISKLYGQIFVPGVESLKAISAKFSDASTKKEQVGEDWSEGEFNATVFSEIAKIGIKSNDYQGWYAQFVQEIFAGKYGMDDLKKGNSIKARDVVKVFSFYTAIIDDPGIDGADLSLEVSTEANKYIEVIKQEKQKLILAGNPTPTDLEISTAANLELMRTGFVALAILLDSDVDKFLELSKNFEKKQKHIQAARYAEYVAGRIYAKYNDGELQKKINVPVPEDKSFWGIDNFKLWEKNNPPDRHEYIDTTETIRMNRSYISINDYFDLSPADRKKYKQEDIILPRNGSDEGVDIVIRLLPDGSGPIPQDLEKAQMVQKLLVDKSDSNGVMPSAVFEYTKAEKKFREKLFQVLAKIEAKYGKSGEDILNGRFPELNEMFNYSAKYKYSEATDSTGQPISVYHYDFDKTVLKDVDGKIVRISPKELFGEMEWFDRKFASHSLKTTTHADQMNYISERVETFVRKQVLSEFGKSRYFKDEEGLLTRVGQAIVQIGKDLKEWIF